MTRGVLWSFAAAVALGVLLVAAAWRTPERFMVEEDSAEYLRLTQNLVSGHGFSQAAAPPYTPDVRRTPVFPFWLSVVFTLNPDLRTAALFGVLISSASVLLLGRVTGVLFGPRAGSLAAVLLAVDLTSAAYATQILTEPLFTLLMLASLLMLVGTWRTIPVATGCAGLLAGVAALCRPIAVLLPLAFIPAIAWRVRTGLRGPLNDAGPNGEWKMAIGDSGCGFQHPVNVIARGFVLVLLPAVLLMGAWTYRNHLAAGVTTLTSLVSTNTYFHRAAYVAALGEHRRVEDIRAEWEAELRARAGTWTEAERIAWLNERGRDLILRHPIDYALVALRGLARMLGPDAIVLPAVLGMDPASIAAAALRSVTWGQLLVVYALAAFGLVRGLSARPRATLVPVAVILYFVVIGGPEMYPRFRVPLMPLFCMLAGICGARPAGRAYAGLRADCGARPAGRTYAGLSAHQSVAARSHDRS